ncbi:MAG: 2,3-diketo-5-methylthio-1-phosphopentane phosphatase [Hyphomicrobiales bacterium]|nr:MAG: 2,3-diketo-5-methylthio-1-phosphopentane phosphatase [Hyphomicrobiales bacterium]
MSLAGVNCHVFVDFDGTIVPCDATDLIFESFALDSWRDVEREWQSGAIGSRECMTRQVALLRASPAAMLDKISEIKVDEGFSTFVEECKSRGIGMTVVSDGFDFVIERVLKNAGHPDLRFRANRLESAGGDKWRVTFPHSRSECQVLAGNCKCSFTEPHAQSVKIVIGDGRSDFCVAGRADLVFAKGTLLKLCQSNGTTHFAYNDFFTVTRQFSSWLNSRPGRLPGARAAVA